MADFPRIKWLNVDGQQVPFTEPQHFTGNGDETVRTGKDNPLPVANYTKKGNIWLPVSEKNPVPTQVTGSNVVEIETLANAVTLDTDEDINKRVEVTDESYILFSIQIDQPNWSVRTRDITGSLYYGRAYPDYKNEDKTPSIEPSFVLPLGFSYNSLGGSTDKVTSFEEALRVAIPPNYLKNLRGDNFRLTYHGDIPATASVKLFRVWRDR